VIGREGFAALSIRSLAKELGTSHPTLYNYIGAIDEIEAKVVHELIARLPSPQAGRASELRAQLWDYLMAAKQLILQHPGVMISTPGSASDRAFQAISARWIHALRPHVPDDRTTLLAMGALASTVLAFVERERLMGPDHDQRMRKVPGISSAGIETAEGYLDAMIDFVLPGLARGVEPAKRKTRSASARP
jgi:AcrR family transcriptional regulator